MNTRSRFAALFLILGLGLSAFVTPSFAAPTKSFLLNPPSDSYGLPKFGFSSSTIYGYGERVLKVRYGSRAEQLGLERGDIILSLNGYKLTYTGAWNDALSQALYDGNYIRLKVRDVRTGNIYFRDTYVDYNSGPVEHYFKKNGPVDSHPHNDVHDAVKTIKEVKELFN